MNDSLLREKLRQNLKQSRYIHSVGVAETARRLAQRFGVSPEQAYIAGLLHDCAREFPVTEMIAAAEARKLSISQEERVAPILLHAALSGALLEEKYEVVDTAIKRAVCLHTVGGANMTGFDKIVYLADMIEPGRDFPQVEELRRAAENDLDDAMLAAFDQSLSYMLQKRQLIHPNTVTARNEILLQRLPA